MKYSIFGLLFLFCTRLISLSQSNAVDCSNYLKYAYETSKKTAFSTEEIYAKLFNTRFENIHDMKQMGINLGVTIPIEGVPVDFDGSYKNESDRVYVYQQTIENTFKSSTMHYLNTESITINSGVVQLASQCIINSSSQVPGLHMWLTKTPNDDIFALNAEYIPNDVNRQQATITKFGLIPKGSAMLESSTNALAAGKRIRPGEQVQVFFKRISKGEISFDFQSNPKQVWDDEKSLPSLPPPYAFEMNKAESKNYKNVPFASWSFTNDKPRNVRAKFQVEFDIAPTPGKTGSFSAVELYQKVNENYILMAKSDPLSFTSKITQDLFINGQILYQAHGQLEYKAVIKDESNIDGSAITFIMTY